MRVGAFKQKRYETATLVVTLFAKYVESVSQIILQNHSFCGILAYGPEQTNNLSCKRRTRQDEEDQWSTKSTISLKQIHLVEIQLYDGNSNIEIRKY